MDVGTRVPGAVDSLEGEEQWTAAVEKVILRAVEEGLRYRALVPDLAAVASGLSVDIHAAEHDFDDRPLVAA